MTVNPAGSVIPAVLKKRHMNDWVIEGPTKISRHSVISANHYVGCNKATGNRSGSNGRKRSEITDGYS